VCVCVRVCACVHVWVRVSVHMLGGAVGDVCLWGCKYTNTCNVIMCLVVFC